MFFWISFLLLCLLQGYIFFRVTLWKGKGRWQAMAVFWMAAALVSWWNRHVLADTPDLQLLYIVFFFWIGFSILACCSFFCVDLLYCLLAVITRVYPLRRLPAMKSFQSSWLFQKISPRGSAPYCLFLALLCSCYAVWEAHDIRPRYQAIVSKKLRRGAAPIRLAVVSDVHLSRMIGPGLLQKIVTVVNAARPDIFISLGDLVDTDMLERDEDARILRTIKAPLGKFGVTGNHEYYRGVANSLDFYKRAGITLLRGQSVSVGPLELIGVDDPTFTRKTPQTTRSWPHLQAKKKSKQFIILLAHRPDTPLRNIGYFDLQLSGHLHGDQLWPGRILFYTLLHKKTPHLSELQAKNGRKSLMFITHGAGFWGPPMRFFTPPEVVIIDIKPAE